MKPAAHGLSAEPADTAEATTGETKDETDATGRDVTRGAEVLSSCLRTFLGSCVDQSEGDRKRPHSRNQGGQKPEHGLNPGDNCVGRQHKWKEHSYHETEEPNKAPLQPPGPEPVDQHQVSIIHRGAVARRTTPGTTNIFEVGTLV